MRDSRYPQRDIYLLEIESYSYKFCSLQEALRRMYRFTGQELSGRPTDHAIGDHTPYFFDMKPPVMRSPSPGPTFSSTQIQASSGPSEIPYASGGATQQPPGGMTQQTQMEITQPPPEDLSQQAVVSIPPPAKVFHSAEAPQIPETKQENPEAQLAPLGPNPGALHQAGTPEGANSIALAAMPPVHAPPVYPTDFLIPADLLPRLSQATLDDIALVFQQYKGIKLALPRSLAHASAPQPFDLARLGLPPLDIPSLPDTKPQADGWNMDLAPAVIPAEDDSLPRQTTGNGAYILQTHEVDSPSSII